MQIKKSVFTVLTFTYSGIGQHYTIEWERADRRRMKGVIEDAGFLLISEKRLDNQ